MKLEENDGIVFMEFKTKFINLEVAMGIMRERLVFTKNRPFLYFVDNSMVCTVTKEARDFFGEESNYRNLLSMAIFSTTEIGMFMANFIIVVCKKKITIPIKSFSNKELAISWLNSTNKQMQ